MLMLAPSFLRGTSTTDAGAIYAIMYLKRLVLQNTGPISDVSYTLPFAENGNPKPLVLVGPNGSGKSIVLSFVANALLATHATLYDKSEVEKGRVYKLRSPGYIRSGQEYYFGHLVFENGIETTEWQLRMTRKAYEEKYGPRHNHISWKLINEDKGEVFWSNMEEKQSEVEKLVDQNCLLYFPANRFEEPGWLNLENLTRRAELKDFKRISGRSNRTIIQHAPLARNRNFLLDVIFDRNLNELKMPWAPVSLGTLQFGLQPVIPSQIPPEYAGPSTMIDRALNEILQVILRNADAHFSVGPRKSRTISVDLKDQQWVPNVFQLSTGETAVLNLFLSIIRDYDESGATFTTLEDVRGIVIVDEIDAHLHCELQSIVLPKLIKRFPKVQFILTSHSPLFLLGLRNELTEDGFVVLELPEAGEIGVERFSEFQRAFDTLKNSDTYKKEIASAIDASRKPLVVVEGDYDIHYLTKAAQFLNRAALLQSVQLHDGGGFGSIQNLWKNLDRKFCNALAQRVVLLFDCDVKTQDDNRGKVARRVIPTVANNPVRKGIENLFPESTIAKARAHNGKFIDVTPEIRKTVRGEEALEPEILQVNSDEKKNLCTWLCKDGTAEDFSGFGVVFDLIEQALEVVEVDSGRGAEGQR